MIQFYLAFENSLCRDYITEKFWKVSTEFTVIFANTVKEGSELQCTVVKYAT